MLKPHRFASAIDCAIGANKFISAPTNNMSLFRRPKKPMARRVFGANSDDEIDGSNGDNTPPSRGGDDDSMDVDADLPTAPTSKERRSEKKATRDVDKPKKNSLLSFDDDGKGETFN